jgi:hypothetical protein
MRDVRPANGALNPWHCPWPSAFAGTIGGRPSAALVNISEEPKTWKLKEFEGLGESSAFEELLQGTDLSSGEITVPPHDAALVVAK